MARLEIPSIVVHKGKSSRSDLSRPESPAEVVCAGAGGMPALPSSKQSLVYSNLSKTNMIDGNANPNVVVTTTTSSTANNNNNNSNSNSNSNSHNNAPTSQNSQQRSATNYPPDKQETENKHFRNRGNTKFKLLVRSHAMRESPSPPREPHNDSSSSHSPQIPIADGDKKFTGNLSPNSSNAKLNNNESMFNSNLCPGQSPKQMRNTATSPTCRTHTRNGQSSPSQTHSPKNITSPVNGNKSKATSPNNNVQKCNNCLKNNQTSNNERPGLLQTPISPSKSTGGGQALQHSPKSTNLAHNEHNKSEHSNRRPNTLNVCNNQCSNQCGNTLSVSRPGSRHKLRHQNLSQGSFDSATSCLSRDSSTELYTDSTGIDLEQFIAETINRNQKDRTVLLKIEKDLIEFTKDRQKVSHKFPNMSSYNRMLVHRVAAYFGMEHNVDQTGLSVIVTRTKNMRIPETRFKEHIRDDLILTEEPRRSILKRDSSSFEDSFNFKSSDRLSGEYCRRSKSFEEREEEYERARRRIFKDSSGESSGITSWPYWSSSESSDASARYQLLHPADHNVRQTRLMKGQSFDGRDSFRGGVLRPSVSKSFSFGGYTRGMLSRVDSVTSTHSAGARLTKQDSGTSMCSRLSPSSSGYKSQSQRSDATISPSPSPSPVGAMACNHTQISSQDSTASSSAETNGQTVIWAVSSISSVPAGSIIIDPQTNQPYTNADGSIYRFDPENPPKIFQEDHEGHVALSKPSDSSSRSATNSGSCGKPENKRKEKQSMKCSNNLINNNNNNSNNHHHGVVNNTGNQDEPVIASVAATATTSTTTTTAPTSCTTTSTVVSTNVTNSSTSPSLPFTPPLSQQPPIPGGGNPTGQSLVKSTGTVQTCNHNPTSQQPYASYLSTSEPFNNQAVYQPPTIAQQTVMMAPRTASQGQPAIQPSNNGQTETIYNQNPVYANYAVPVQQGSIHNPGEIPELSRYFLGMNICYQRAGGDSQNAPPSHGYSQPPPAPPPPPPSTNQTLPAAVQPNYWQTPSNQIPTQQMMYFVPPSGTAMSSELHQQQRLTTTYSFNTQTMTPPSQTTSNYVSSYPVPYNSMPTVNPTPGEYTYPPPVHMVPAYYPPGQPSMPPPPVMYRVPTPPNTPTSNQMPGVPMMYVNSDSYPPPMVSTGTFGANGTSPAPGAYMTPALVPNLVFRQNVPVVTGMRASTPCSSQRASRSPTPAHELFGAANGERNAQVQPRYPLPMYQDVRIVQGDMRFMHPGVAGNPRFQYAPVPSPPVVQGCPRPYRPPSYSSNSSGGATTTSFDGRSQKIRKQRSKISSLPPSGPRPNLYQTPAMQPVSSNTPRDIREGTVKVTITRRNHFVQC